MINVIPQGESLYKMQLPRRNWEICLNWEYDKDTITEIKVLIKLSVYVDETRAEDLCQKSIVRTPRWNRVQIHRDSLQKNLPVNHRNLICETVNIGIRVHLLSFFIKCVTWKKKRKTKLKFVLCGWCKINRLSTCSLSLTQRSYVSKSDWKDTFVVRTLLSQFHYPSFK